jgi:hypothetical protein
MYCSFADRDMFMRFRGGGVGHLGTRHLDSRLKENNHDSVDAEQDEATLAGRHEDNSSYLQEGEGKDADEDSETDEEHTTKRIPSNEGDEEDEDGIEVEDESEDEAEDENENELEAKDDDDDEEVMDDDEILNEEGYISKRSICF